MSTKRPKHKEITFVIPRISADEMTVAVVRVGLLKSGLKLGLNKANTFLAALRQAATEWMIADPDIAHGYLHSEADFNIGDLSMYSTLDLARLVKRMKGVESIDIQCHVDLSHDSSGSSWTYDTVLVDAAKIEAHYGG